MHVKVEGRSMCTHESHRNTHTHTHTHTHTQANLFETVAVPSVCTWSTGHVNSYVRGLSHFLTLIFGEIDVVVVVVADAVLSLVEGRAAVACVPAEVKRARASVSMAVRCCSSDMSPYVRNTELRGW